MGAAGEGLAPGSGRSPSIALPLSYRLAARGARTLDLSSQITEDLRPAALEKVSTGNGLAEGGFENPVTGRPGET
jgi:hypothetical protein